MWDLKTGEQDSQLRGELERADPRAITALAAGQPPPAPYADPDVYAQVAAVIPGFTLEPGGTAADLTVTLQTADPASARTAAEAIAARLAPRLRRGIAFRLG